MTQVETTRTRSTTKERLIMLLVGGDIILGFSTLATETLLISLLFGVLVFISGLWLLYAVVGRVMHVISSRNWVEVPYQVVEARLSMQMTPIGHHTKFTPFFKIKYDYNGYDYTRTSEDDLNIPVSIVFATPHKAEEYLYEVRRFKYGNTVYVNPKAPSCAYLNIRPGRNLYGMLLFSIILIAMPLFTLMGLIEWR